MNYEHINSIRELKKLQDEALQAYHNTNSELAARIQAIREKRSYTAVVQTTSRYYEQGRDSVRKNGNW